MEGMDVLELQVLMAVRVLMVGLVPLVMMAEQVPPVIVE